MSDAPVELLQQDLGFVGHDGPFQISPGEALDRRKRSPPRNDEDLHAFWGVPLQEQSAGVPIEASQLGEHVVLQMGGVRGCLC